MDKLIDLGMTKLFQLAEYVCSKAAIKQVQSQTCLRYAECEQARLKIKCSPDKGEPAAAQPQQVVPTIRFSNEDKMVEGELFKYNTISLGVAILNIV